VLSTGPTLFVGFFVAAPIALVVMLTASAGVCEATVRRMPVPVAVLQLSGRMVPEGPDRSVVVQGVRGDPGRPSQWRGSLAIAGPEHCADGIQNVALAQALGIAEIHDR
jgi:hypothetical protein